MNAEIKRIFPGPVNGLINWMEQNFHDIDQFVITFKMKDNTTITVYDAYSYFEALGIAAFTTDVIQRLSVDGDFVPKEKV